MRIMKRETICVESDLIAKVTDALKNQFVPKTKDVQRWIEGLAASEYLEGRPGNKWIYLP